MASNPATALDLSNRSLRTLSYEELKVGVNLLSDAFNIIVTTVPSVATRLDAVPLDTRFQSLVVQIECAMVLRLLNNPDGKLEESADDYSYRLDQAVSSGALYLSDAESTLLSTRDGYNDRAFTIRPSGSTPDTNHDWVEATSWFPFP